MDWRYGSSGTVPVSSEFKPCKHHEKEKRTRVVRKLFALLDNL
jgi:hypothetical protein